MEVEWDIHGIHARLNEKIEYLYFFFRQVMFDYKKVPGEYMGQKINDEMGNYGRYIYIYIYIYLYIYIHIYIYNLYRW